MKCAICVKERARIGHACTKCVDRIRRHLREIGEWALEMDATPGHGSSERRAPGYASRPPARLDVICARDSRSTNCNEDEDSAPAVLTDLELLARWWRHEHGDPLLSGHPSFTQLLDYLRGQLHWACEQPWIDVAAKDIDQIHSKTRYLAGRHNPIRARCIEMRNTMEGPILCAGPVRDDGWKHPTGERITGVRCGKCDRRYSGTDMYRLFQDNRSAA